MTWDEINNRRLPFIRFGENLFKRMYGEMRKSFIASIQDVLSPEAITQAARDYQVDESLVRISYERFYLKTSLSFARNIAKSYNNRMERKDINDDILQEVWYQQIMEFVRTKVGNNITSVIRTQYADIQKITKAAVETGIDNGWGMDKIARAIQKDQGVMDFWKAQRIARTEVVTASNVGVKVGYEQLPGNKEKVWISTFDNRSRPDHMAMDGTRVAVNELFELPSGNQLEFPGDPSGAAEDIINCRCGYEILVTQEY